MTPPTQPSAAPDDDPWDQPHNQPQDSTQDSTPSSPELEEPAPIALQFQRGVDRVEAEKKTLETRITMLLGTQCTTEDIRALVRYSQELERTSKQLADWPVNSSLKAVKKDVRRIGRGLTKIEEKWGRWW
ncbi:uncharacterized protein BDZ99DRAFT_235086 [Mytilinidion resinicola]|uniref:Uncharacterized protein n=1 Tax=Mytilinidion resinicola TaxID=574789 RepID=A0A6A6Z253_9PEZI|nr:uncharacterized protein BDZ99DRAFT_235086 [Mytilinidion resinicola]KAF2814307.1 hypothetical protein BDZ99DRAFT_235086 [Mytilinidion resinicola]